MRKSHLCVIVDSDCLGARDAVGIARAAITGGADMLQLRGKTLSFNAWYALGRAIQRLTRPSGIPLIINDRLDVALALDADGVHAGQGDLTPRALRRSLGAHKIIGVSVSTIRQARRAITGGADYLGVGPVFRTPLKSRKPVRMSHVRSIQRLGLPVFAIGGIDLTTLPALTAGGINRIAVIRAVCMARNPGRVTAELQQELCAV